MAPFPQQANAFSNRARRVRIVSRDHDGTDAGARGSLQGRVHFWPGRVDHADKPNKHQVFF